MQAGQEGLVHVGLGGETLKNLKKGSHTFRAKAIYQGVADPTPAKKTWKVN